jgi:hypothetical protein
VPRDGDVISDAYNNDPAWAAAEYGGEFRDDICSFVTREALEAIVAPGVSERPPVEGTAYSAFTDPSGGQSDSMTLAIGHAEDDKAVIDLVREVRPPFSPEAIVEEFVADLARYRVSAIRGDRYGAMWVREQFQKRGVEYWPSEKSKSDLYMSLLPAINSKQIDLLDNDRLITQLATLERRTVRGGRDSIDHRQGGHDDLGNAVAGCVHAILGVPAQLVATGGAYLFEAATGKLINPPSWLADKPLTVDLTDELPWRPLG